MTIPGNHRRRGKRVFGRHWPGGAEQVQVPGRRHSERSGRTGRDPRMEPVDFYKASGLKIVEWAGEQVSSPPPWLGVSPELPVYRERGGLMRTRRPTPVMMNEATRSSDGDEM